MTVCDCLDWFYRSKGDLSDKGQILWFWLFAVALRNGSWVIQVDNIRLMNALGIKNRDAKLKKVKDELIEKGMLVVVTPGRKGKPTVYKLVFNSLEKNGETATPAKEEPAVKVEVVEAEVLEEKESVKPVVAETETAIDLNYESIRPDKEAQKRARERLCGKMRPYGKYGKVLLTDEGMRQLKEMCPTDWYVWIEKMDSYCMQHNRKPYRDTVETVQNWMRSDFKKNHKDFKDEVKTGMMNALAVFAQSQNENNKVQNKFDNDDTKRQEALF